MKRMAWIRLGALVLFLVGMALLGKFTVLGDYFELGMIQQHVAEAGVWGILLFLGLFMVGMLLYIPGMVFVIAALILFGPIKGALLGYSAAVIAIGLNFYIIRAIGGQPISVLKLPRWLQRIMDHMDARPVRTIFLLRSVLWFAPPLTHYLAMTKTKGIHFHLGNALGLIIPVGILTLGYVFFREVIMGWLG